MRTKEELKKIACAAIDARKDDIIAFADAVYATPEFGYKEFKTAATFQKTLEDLGVEYRSGIARTGVIGNIKGNESKIKVAVMGELDAIKVGAHKDANPDTGAVHACGHNAQITSVAAIAMALQDTDIMKDLAGDVVLMGVPAEECIEIAFRKQLIDSGEVSFLGGKPEFIKLGEFDDVDIAIMQHTCVMGQGYKAGATSSNNGFIVKMINYKGKEAHAGAAPYEGVNALNAAMLGMMAVHAQRETFKDDDHIRVHGIITKGGDIVNVVPHDVRLESYVRGGSAEAILDASAKVDRAYKSGADAVGATCDITTLPGYLPAYQCEELNDIMFENLKELYGDEAQKYCAGFGGGSSDQGDVSYIMPSIQSYFAGVTGGLHSEFYCLADKENATLGAAKSMLMTIIDLLYDGAEKGLEVKKNFKAPMTKEQYLREWGHLTE